MGYSLIGLLFGIVFQIAFGAGVLAVMYSCMKEDETAAAAFPYIAAALWIFWIPFILRNCWVYIRDWRAEAAERRLIGRVDRDKTDSAKKAAKQARRAAKDAEKAAKDEARALEEERRRREQENREWQERTTREQREQNQRLNREQDERAERFRRDKAEQERIQREQEDKIYRMSKKYWTEPNAEDIRKAYDRRQELEENIGKAYRNAGDLGAGMENAANFVDKGSDAIVNSAAEFEKCPYGPLHLVKSAKDLIKPTATDTADSLSRGDYWGAAKGLFVTGQLKGIMNVVQNYCPIGNINVTLEAAKAKADCWRLGMEGEEARNYIEQKVTARKVYENTGTVMKIATGSETAANVFKEVSSNLFTNDATERWVAGRQSKRVKNAPSPSKFVNDLQSRIQRFKTTQQKIDLR